VKILFLARNYTYFRNFESVVRELARRGHLLHLAVERSDAVGSAAIVEALAAEFPSVTYGEAPSRKADEWSWVVQRLRLGLDYLRYQHPVFDTAWKLRERSRERTPGAFVRIGSVARALGGWSRRLVTHALRGIERAVPEDPAIRGYLESQRPDLLLLTPLVDLGSSQIEYLRAARALRVPAGLCVWSWDHLSSKALIRDAPDRVFVWNATQKQEAITLHDVPPDCVVVTGAQCFDWWFDRQPSRDAETFRRDAGVASSPYLLWVCSALIHGSAPEAPFVRKWIETLRRSGSSRLRTIPILVRPHPSRQAEWDGVDLSALNAVVWGGNPVDVQSRADYFDTLHYSAAVVGINTSAFIEAAILGRPVYTLVVPETADNQTGTVHFNYLLNAGGGLLEVARSFDEHAAQLDQALETPHRVIKPFVREFVRPHGLDVVATVRFVEAVESMETLTVASPHADPFVGVWRWAASRAARMRDDERYERWTLSSRELASLEKLRGARRLKALRRAEERRAHNVNTPGTP
jgi:hypothetical protein